MNRASLEVLDVSSIPPFAIPLKEINEGHDVSRFLVSQAYGDIMTFVMQLNRSLFPCHIENLDGGAMTVQVWELEPSNVSYSSTVRHLRTLLGKLHAIIDEVPPDPGPRRFGNVSFRKWYDFVEDRLGALLDDHLPASILSLSSRSTIKPQEELKSYLMGSFGSPQRLDYGTGHELSFLAFLGCIWKLGGFDASRSGNEERGIVLGVFEPYLHLIRRLIKTYTLEPAGSHGVWGLDDQSFLPYLFGSAQYGPAVSPLDQTPVEGSREDAPNPADVTKATAVERERRKNMYFSAIGFIYDIKKGPFWEHSPILYDISGVRAGWAKINKGMIKMYNAEVLSKFPVVQHFYFGSLFTWDQDPAAPPPPASVHTSNQPVTGDLKSLQIDRKTHQAKEVATSTIQGGMKAPWTSQSAATTTPFVGTAAPWARKSSSTDPTIAFPSSTTYQRDSNLPFTRSSTSQSNASFTRSTGMTSAALSPSTKAPWAKDEAK